MNNFVKGLSIPVNKADESTPNVTTTKTTSELSGTMQPKQIKPFIIIDAVYWMWREVT